MEIAHDKLEDVTDVWIWSLSIQIPIIWFVASYTIYNWVLVNWLYFLYHKNYNWNPEFSGWSWKLIYLLLEIVNALWFYVINNLAAVFTQLRLFIFDTPLLQDIKWMLILPYFLPILISILIKENYFSHFFRI